MTDFAVGFERPFGLLKDTVGDALLISDYGTDTIYRVRRRLPTDPPDCDIDRSGNVDVGDLHLLMRERRDLLLNGPPAAPDFLKSDFNGDGTIDAVDLFLFCRAWEGFDGP
ncbi:MAG: dockerin type I domain-containing protein [Armatimonadota bacterium]